MKTTHKLLLIAAMALLASCKENAQEKVTVVPYPNEVIISHGTFNAKQADLHYEGISDTNTIDAIRSFAEALTLASGKPHSVSEGPASTGIIFRKEPGIAEEAYELRINRRKAEVTASSFRGFNYAIQTMKQMLPAAIYGNTSAPGDNWEMQCAVIKDAPRFAYRGLHLDVSRHFFGIDEVKKYLDIMEMHKLNTFHWHLTDDQGWRIEIKKYPRLTEIGAVRNKTLVGHKSVSKEYDHTPYGEGCWFSQEQIKEIIRYADSKGITVIPEIDLPGHMLAVLAAYPELGCTGGPYEVWGRWGISKDVLCAGKESTMQFLEDVLSEICGLFPSEYIHIGGDECPKVRWEACPVCQAKITELGLKDDGRHSAEHYLQSYVMERMEKFLASKGKRTIGWDEILEGEVAPDATVMSWRGTEGGIQAVRMGHDAIMTPNSYFYLDYYQSEDKENEPLAIGGFLPIEKCYSYEPFTEDMTEEEKGHILGVQANLWTEYIATPEHLHYMLLPRLAALSEVQWCNKDNKDWERFAADAPRFCAIYDAMGYNYATHILIGKK